MSTQVYSGLSVFPQKFRLHVHGIGRQCLALDKLVGVGHPFVLPMSLTGVSGIAITERLTGALAASPQEAHCLPGQDAPRRVLPGDGPVLLNLLVSGLSIFSKLLSSEHSVTTTETGLKRDPCPF